MNRLILAAAVLALAGCNTVQGLGKDLQTIGGVVTGTAEGVQNASGPPAQLPPAEGSTAPSNCEPDSSGLVLEGCPAPK